MNKKDFEIKVEAFKKKYGRVYHYTVREYSEKQKARMEKGENLDDEEPDGEEKSCFLKSPDRRTLSAAAVVGKNDPLKYNEVLLNNCWIEGDEVIRTDDSYFLGVSGVLSEIISIKEGKLKKL